MFTALSAFSGFSVDDLSAAKTFYTEVLGLEVDQDEMGLQIHLPSGVSVFVYEKPNHQPATFTVLNFVVEDIDVAIEALQDKGVTFIHYHTDQLPQDDKGILRGIAASMGPDIAWFTDPAGNVLSILQES